MCWALFASWVSRPICGRRDDIICNGLSSSDHRTFLACVFATAAYRTCKERGHVARCVTRIFDEFWRKIAVAAIRQKWISEIVAT